VVNEAATELGIGHTGQVSIDGKHIYAGVSEHDGKEWDVYEPLVVGEAL
jgi:hypothetical protein